MKKKIYGTLKSIKEICGLDLFELLYEDGALYSKNISNFAGIEYELIPIEDHFYDYMCKSTSMSVKKEWLKDIREEYEFEVDDKVWVRNYDCDKWLPRYFAKKENDYLYHWGNGCTSFTVGNDFKMFRARQCIPHLYDGYDPNNEETK